jgi:hypothetical protein
MKVRGITLYFFFENVFHISIQINRSKMTKKVKILIVIKHDLLEHVKSALKFKTRKIIMNSAPCTYDVKFPPAIYVNSGFNEMMKHRQSNGNRKRDSFL